jgi:hypothetical protein
LVRKKGKEVAGASSARNKRQKDFCRLDRGPHKKSFSIPPERRFPAIQLRLEDGTVWLSQKEMAQLYQVNEEELDTLNRIVTMFLDQAEFRARRRQIVYMADWESWLDKFLADEELPVLTHAGHIRSGQAICGKPI